MAANLTSGNAQSYDPGHGIRIFQGLDPDIALVQEFNYGDNSQTAINTFVSDAFAPEFHYHRESGQIPNGIVSRYPIVAAGEWDDPFVDNRDFVWARIDLPGAREIWAISVHLLTTSTGNRQGEANALLTLMAENIPSGAHVVLGGDFNTGTRTEACITELSSRFVTTGPWPTDQAGTGMTNAPRTKPLDWVLAVPELDAMQMPVEIAANRFPFGLVFDSRVYDPVSDVLPVLETDSAAVGMQHMAVVRDFLIP